jgi:putative oxidoreductase
MLSRLSPLVHRAHALLTAASWTGPLLVRLTLGVVFLTTGWGKLHNLDNVAQFFTSLEIPAPYANAVLVSSIELVGGIAILLGLGTRIAAALLVGVMAVAIWTAKLPAIHGIADLAGTVEMIYLAAFAWLLVAGPGAASLDRVVDRALRRWRGSDGPSETAHPAVV